MKIETGYTSGLIGSVVEMHSRYYSQSSGFGATFEAKVAAGLADFVTRLDNSRNQIWHARIDGKISASIAIDGQDMEGNSAHLRWFLVDDNMRGKGVGNKLMQAAMEFCIECGFDVCVLWTFKGLDAARRIYEKNGFSLADEWEGNQWGSVVCEQRFERLLKNI